MTRIAKGAAPVDIRWAVRHRDTFCVSVPDVGTSP